MTQATMEIIVNEGHDRTVYPGTSVINIPDSLPEYHGGVTMTIRVNQSAIEEKSISRHITIDADLYGGVPSIGRGNWPVSHILQSLASGFLPEKLIRDYPGLTLEDIQLALDIAAWVLKEPSIDWNALDLMGMTDLQKELQDWQSLGDEAIFNSDDI